MRPRNRTYTGATPMKHPNIRWIIPTAAFSLLTAVACGAGSEPAPTPAAPPAAAPSESVSPPAAAVMEPSAPAVGVRVGDRAPDFTLTLSQDRRISSSDLVAQGKPVFILFHATW